MEFFFDIWRYMLARKKYWLMPVIIIFLLLGILIIFGGNSVLAPFIYTIF
jgi:hypothetical protein